MSQVHTTFEFDKTAKRIKSEIHSNQIGSELSVYASGDPVWPLTAYFKGLKGYKYQANNKQIEKMCYIFDSFDKPTIKKPKSFLEKKVTLRGWWVPDYEKVTLKKYITYLLTHKNWNSSGFSYSRMYINLSPKCGYL